MAAFSSRLQSHFGNDVGALSDIMHDSAFCSTREELLSVVTRTQSICGFQSAILALVRDCGEGAPQLVGWINHSYPHQWLDLYQREGFSQVDPVFLTHRPDSVTRRWKDTYRKHPPPVGFLSAAMDYGLCDGWTTGICHSQSRESSLMSFSWGKKTPVERQGALLHLMAPHLHQALVRSLDRKNAKPDGALSPKESEVLAWIKQGKSNWEISAILNISERTVKFHVSNVMGKLNAVNRGHAVALAMERGL